MSPNTIVKSIVFAVIFSAGASGAAFARDDIFTARLVQPAAQSRLIANSAVWTCEGDSCVARTSHAATIRTCRQFVREAGIAVTAFGPENARLTEEELASCNADLAPETQQARN